MNEAYFKSFHRLLENGAGADDVVVNGNTPLMNVTGSCNAKRLKMLVDAGADPTEKNAKGETALALALKKAVQFPIPGTERWCNTVVIYLQGLTKQQGA